MEAKNDQPTTVDEYIAGFPEDVQQVLQKIRAVVKETAPKAEEKISYGMAGYYLNGGLVWFGAYKRHIGFYPATPGMEEAFGEEVMRYRASKGTLRFPLKEPMPYELIGRIVRFRVAENLSEGGVASGDRTG